MQFIDGDDLATHLAGQGPLEPEQAVDVIAQIASALDAAHAAGLVHRDVKPANVLVKDGKAYLTDFGLTKQTAASKPLTETGQTLGTVGYMAPEQIEGQTVDHRSDVYALGCLLYHCLTGAAPFERDTAVATIYAHLSEPPPRPSTNEKVPDALDAVVQRALAKHPDDRFQSAGELAEAARAALSGIAPTLPAPRRRRTRPRTGAAGRRPARPLLIGAGLAMVAILAAVLVIALGGDDEKEATVERFTVRTIPLQGNSFGVAADPQSSSVWVTSADKGLLTRIDTSSNEPVEPPLRLGEDPFGLAVGTHLWVPLFGEGVVLRMPAARRIGTPERVRVGGEPTQVAVTAGAAWVVDETGFVKRIDPDTMRLKGRPVPVGPGARQIAADFAGAWASNTPRGTVTRIDEQGRVVGRPIKVGSEPAGVALAAGKVWVANTGDGTVSVLDARTGRPVGRPVPVGRGPFGVAAGEGYVWVTNTGGNSVSRLDPKTARVVGRPIRVGPAPIGISVGRGAVWVGTSGAQALSVIRISR
jgi:serine/threonine-protein kinase